MKILSTKHSSSVFLYCACNLPVRGKTVFLFQDLHSAQKLETEAVLVIDQNAICDIQQLGTGYHATHIPQDAILNLDPYAPPRTVTAAGGIVQHRNTGEILCIRRHGVLDLPKGKLDPNESISACAMRELQEETGIRDLHQGELLGTTVHGYLRSGFFEIKTTYWYDFTSESTQFVPATEEGISAVFWIPYSQAEQMLGYAPLQRLLADLRLVRQNRNTQ